jgi:AraC-like DNA-binding protein
MEVLTDILGGLRTSGSVYFCDFLEPPWQLDFADEEKAIFHLVRRGRCQVKVAGEVHEMGPGDFVFLSPGVDHVMRGTDANDPKTMLLCGYCRFEFQEDDVLMRALPRFVLLHKDEMDDWPWLTRTLDHLGAEYMSGAPGSELTVNKLTEVLLVQLLRVDFGRDDRAGIVAALKDKRLNKALTKVHQSPGDDWTIASAADVAAMSRSGFARLFKNTLEMSFFAYLTRLRMRLAREMLRTSVRPVAIIGERVGYQSELSFVKAFKKLHGMTPRAFRQQGEQQ